MRASLFRGVKEENLHHVNYAMRRRPCWGCCDRGIIDIRWSIVHFFHPCLRICICNWRRKEEENVPLGCREQADRGRERSGKKDHVQLP